MNVMNRKIILVRGIQGSGKSTWSRKWAEEKYRERVRISNDDIRNMLGKYWVPSREDLVHRIKVNSIEEAMELGYDIVIDNMNLNPKESDLIQNLIDQYNKYSDMGFFSSDKNYYHYDMFYQDFKTPLDECIRRDALRENPIGCEVITNTYNKYKLFYEQETESVVD